jgi:hypothetical protein
MGNEKINRFSNGFYRLSAYFCGGIIYDRYFCEVNMTEHPILFSGPMVRAILDGRKSMTRRIVKFNESHRVKMHHKQWHIEDENVILGCPYGQVGSKLWVKETHYLYGQWVENGLTKTGRQKWKFIYEKIWCKYLDNKPGVICVKKDQVGWFKRPSIFMPRWASRITLEITNVRVERLATLSEKDAQREGLDSIESFKNLWNKLNKKEGTLWKENPWVWILEFQKVSL